MSILVNTLGLYLPELQVPTSKRFFWVRAVILSLLALLMVGASLFFKWRYWPGVDDAYITYRYAWNFFQGQGLVWNPGGEAVQGYSTLLYALVMSLGFFLYNHDDIYEWSFIVNLACGLVAMLVLYRFARAKHRLGENKALILTSLFSMCPAISYHIWTGLGTGPIILLQILIWIGVERVVEKNETKDIVQVTLASVAAVLSRADGFITPLLATIYLLISGRRHAALMVGTMIALTFLCLSGWQQWYYGDWLPNTARAKTGGAISDRVGAAWSMMFGNGPINAWGGAKNGHLWITRGVFVILAWIVASGSLSLYRFVPLMVGKERLASSDKLTRILPFGTLVATAWVGYWFYLGGDLYLDRFLVFLWPICFYHGLRDMAGISRIGNGILLSVLAVGFAGMFTTGEMATSFFSSSYGNCPRNLETFFKNQSNSLTRRYAGQTVALLSAGKVPFYAPQVNFLDMLGLNDRHIAGISVDKGKWIMAGDNKSDYQYVFRCGPVAIMAPAADDGYLVGNQTVPFKEFAMNGYHPVRIGSGKALQEKELKAVAFDFVFEKSGYKPRR